MSQNHFTNTTTNAISPNQRDVLHVLQEITAEVELLRKDIKICEDAIRVCNIRVSTITSLLSLALGQSLQASPSSAPASHFDTNGGNGEPDLERGSQAQSPLLAQPELTDKVPARAIYAKPVSDGVVEVPALERVSTDTATTGPPQPIQTPGESALNPPLRPAEVTEKRPDPKESQDLPRDRVPPSRRRRRMSSQSHPTIDPKQPTVEDEVDPVPSEVIPPSPSKPTMTTADVLSRKDLEDSIPWYVIKMPWTIQNGFIWQREDGSTLVQHDVYPESRKDLMSDEAVAARLSSPFVPGLA